MPVLSNIGFLATCLDKGTQKDIHPVRDAAIAWEGERIQWVGPKHQLPDNFQQGEIIDGRGKMVIPGLVDCHTHLAFGGWRSDEFEMRVQGKSYLEIAQSGGGILSTVRETRAAGEDELFQKSFDFLRKMSVMGITTVECKSGYGLTAEDELKTLRVYKRLKQEQPLHIVSTFLGAHTIPPEFKQDRSKYIELIIEKMLPAIARDDLAEFCDVFVEKSAFTIEEARNILTAGKVYGLEPKLHADQLTDMGGARLAAELEARSADHLEKISQSGIEAMAKTGVIGVTLPLASLYTQQPLLRARKLVDAGVQVAVATDFNPGSAPSYDLPLAMMLTCNQGGLTPAEVLKGATLYGAKAISHDHTTGSIEAGKFADFAIIDAPDPNFWMYHYRPNACIETYVKGVQVYAG